MRELVGVEPSDDRDGCLQDIHWPGGAWGYFPTYTLGAIAAAQLFDAACRALPEIPTALARGEFAPLIGWLRTHIHARASSASTEEILAAATGRGLDAAVYKAHLRRRYLDV
jgi:carboxypeptidase Taq